MPASRPPLTKTPDGVVVTVRVIPRARRAGIDGAAEFAGARGAETAIAVRVTAPPADGAANAAVMRILAREWRLPPSSLEILSGASSRVKRILVRGEPEHLLRTLSERMTACMPA